MRADTSVQGPKTSTSELDKGHTTSGTHILSSMKNTSGLDEYILITHTTWKLRGNKLASSWKLGDSMGNFDATISGVDQNARRFRCHSYLLDDMVRLSCPGGSLMTEVALGLCGDGGQCLSKDPCVLRGLVEMRRGATGGRLASNPAPNPTRACRGSVPMSEVGVVPRSPYEASSLDGSRVTPEPALSGLDWTVKKKVELTLTRRTFKKIAGSKTSVVIYQRRPYMDTESLAVSGAVLVHIHQLEPETLISVILINQTNACAGIASQPWIIITGFGHGVDDSRCTEELGFIDLYLGPWTSAPTKAVEPDEWASTNCHVHRIASRCSVKAATVVTDWGAEGFDKVTLDDDPSKYRATFAPPCGVGNPMHTAFHLPQDEHRMSTRLYRSRDDLVRAQGAPKTRLVLEAMKCKAGTSICMTRPTSSSTSSVTPRITGTHPTDIKDTVDPKSDNVSDEKVDKANVFIAAVPKDEPLVTRRELTLWSYYLYYNGDSLHTSAGFKPVADPGSSCLTNTASGQCVLPWLAGLHKIGLERRPCRQRISFAIRTSIFTTIGSAETAPEIAILACKVAPDRWKLAKTLYIRHWDHGNVGFVVTYFLNWAILVPPRMAKTPWSITIPLLFICQSPLPGSPLPNGKSYLTIGWKQGLNTTGTLVCTCQNDKINFSFLQFTYPVSTFGFWYIQRYWKISIKTIVILFPCIQNGSDFHAVLGMLGIWTNKVG
ncbi:hypothetical protein BU15DRAFT_60719 [Melanogaster broomeanus]|nr:hypothetical protein BU15DRAFT_60719 [Melanogaster broomeanus]